MATNVPENLRNLWADIYRLYDINYPMQNTGEDWKKFWDQASEINRKYNCMEAGHLITTVSVMLEDHLKGKKYHPCSLENMKLF